MRYGSICSGVEAASLAWGKLGWKSAFFAEVEPFPSAVLMERFGATRPLRPLDPAAARTEKDRKQSVAWLKQIGSFPRGGGIPNLGDFTRIEMEDYDGGIDLLVGGTPCQSYSLAGLRGGLGDERGSLALEFVRLAYRLGVRWLVWENVPGVFSSNKGEDFASFLSMLCGWEVPVPNLGTEKRPRHGWRNSGIVTEAPGCFGLAWRTLDAQYVRVDGYPRAVPQRRRRVFVIGHLGDWRRAAAVLFEPGCLSGNPPARGKAREGVAGAFEVGPSGAGKRDVSCTLDTRCKDGPVRNQVGMAVCMAHEQGNAEVCEGSAATLNSSHETFCLAENIIGRKPVNGGNGTGVQEGIAYTLNATGVHGVATVFQQNQRGEVRDMKSVAGALQASPGMKQQNYVSMCFVEDDAARGGCWEEISPTMRGTAKNAVANADIVRRLTPLECERLMGFPNNHTLIPWKGKPPESCPDGPRYKACGNSMCVNAMRWIGQRIEMVEGLCRSRI